MSRTAHLGGLWVAAAGLFSPGAEAMTVAIDLKDFVAWPDADAVTVAADGRSATFVESAFTTVLYLVNDPFLGDPRVVTPAAGRFLSFRFDFIEAEDGDDVFSAVLFDAGFGAATGWLEHFEVGDTGSGTVSFDLTPHTGRMLGLEFALREQDPFTGTLGSVATVSHLALHTGPPTPVPLPPPLALFSLSLAGLLGLGVRRRLA